MDHKKLSEDYIWRIKNFNFQYLECLMFMTILKFNCDKGMVSISFQLNQKNKIIVKGSLNRYRLIYIDDVVDIWIEAISNKKFKIK